MTDGKKHCQPQFMEAKLRGTELILGEKKVATWREAKEGMTGSRTTNLKCSTVPIS